MLAATGTSGSSSAMLVPVSWCPLLLLSPKVLLLCCIGLSTFVLFNRHSIKEWFRYKCHYLAFGFHERLVMKINDEIFLAKYWEIQFNVLWRSSINLRVGSEIILISCPPGTGRVSLRFFQSSLISLYVHYLTWTAISSTPRHQRTEVQAPLTG